ncbi:hypothetical protein EDC04DRAFT_1298010 [Pisolithus marmoratus]|nr:hypothetical protein EDC04DRAFT_1298010 [Pisolithus marmoratus]
MSCSHLQRSMPVLTCTWQRAWRTMRAPTYKKSLDLCRRPSSPTPVHTGNSHTMSSLAETPFQKYQDWNDAIVSGEHVIRSIQEFESAVKVIKTEHGDAFIYAVASNDENAKTFKIVIGPIEIDITIDLNKLTIVIEVYVIIPFIGKIQIAKAAGNLHDGVTLTIGFPPYVGGMLTLKLDGKDVVLEYSFDALGLHYGGRIVIFTLP